jgi:hypothetical protein
MFKNVKIYKYCIIVVATNKLRVPFESGTYFSRLGATWHLTRIEKNKHYLVLQIVHSNKKIIITR